MRRGRRFVVVLALLLVFAVPAVAADPVERRSSGAAAQLLSIVGLVATPDVTASRLDIDDDGALAGQRIDTLRLANDLTVATADGPLYFEGNLGFARARVDLRLGDDVVEAVDFDAIGAFGAMGPDLRVDRFTRIRPLIILGGGYVSDDFGLPEPITGEDDTPDVDLRQASLTAGFGVSLDHERPLGDDLVDLRLKFAQTFAQTVWSADPRFTGDTVNSTINANAVYKHDTGVEIRGFPLLVTGLAGFNAFLGDQQDGLGFAWFAEYGGGLELDLGAAESAVKRARMRVTGIAGDGVTGISVGIGIGF